MTTTTAPARTQVWQADKIHSSVGFAVRHMLVATFRGNFTEFDVELTRVGDELALRGHVPVASISVADENLKGHLLTPDFFDAERFPEITFSSKHIARDDEQLTVDGELSINGQAKPVRVAGSIHYVDQDMSGNERYGIDLALDIDRRVYGLNWNAPLPSGGMALGNEVKLSVQLELVPKEA
jgi:polyisoprenoid-binding protein YceI